MIFGGFCPNTRVRKENWCVLAAISSSRKSHAFLVSGFTGVRVGFRGGGGQVAVTLDMARHLSTHLGSEWLVPWCQLQPEMTDTRVFHRRSSMLAPVNVSVRRSSPQREHPPSRHLPMHDHSPERASLGLPQLSLPGRRGAERTADLTDDVRPSPRSRSEPIQESPPTKHHCPAGQGLHDLDKSSS